MLAPGADNKFSRCWKVTSPCEGKWPAAIYSIRIWKESFVVNFTKEQKLEIKNMIANASSPAEIERIEACVKKGEFPVVDAIA